MKSRSIRIVMIFFLTCIIWGCQESESVKYKRKEKQELSSGIHQDSLFMGLYFQMPRKEFREYCFAMNQKGKFMQGGMRNTAWVEANLEGLSYPAAINFYPVFKDEVIAELNASIYYDKNAKFKDNTFESDSLLLDVLNLLDRWYGGENYKIESPFYYKDDVYVKINGNRRITISKDISGQLINLWYVDLVFDKRRKDEGID